MTVVVREHETALRMVQDMEDLKAIENVGPGTGKTAQQLRKLVQRIGERRLDELESVRLSVAAALLGLSVPTVRMWVRVGLLEDCGESPARVGMRSVLRVRPIVMELQEQGRDHNLLEAVRAQLEDSALRDNPEFTAALGQMHAGQLRDAELPARSRGRGASRRKRQKVSA